MKRNWNRARGSVWISFAVLVSILLLPNVVLGHAFLEEATPAPGSVVETAPSELQLQFTEPIEVGVSRVEVYHESGVRVDKGTLEAPRGISRDVVVPIEPVGPGVYTVEWRVLSIDTHITQDRYTFTVDPNYVPPAVEEPDEVTDAADDADEVTDAAEAAATADEDSGGTLWLWLMGLGVVIVVLLGALVSRRGGNRA